jgi:hypothetical protein
MRYAHLAVILTLAPTLAMAEDQNLEAIRLEIASLQVDHALNLTRDQAKALLPVLREGATHFQQVKQAREANKPALLAALTRARDELRSTGAISEGTRQAVRAARGDGQFKAEHQKMRELKDRAMQILTPQQKEVLEQTQLGVGMGAGVGPEQMGGFGGGEEIAKEEGHHGRGFMKHMIMARVVVSDPFLALVEARAR